MCDYDMLHRLREQGIMDRAEIERLTARVSQLEQLGDDLERVAFHETQGQCIGHRAWKPVKAWREARRG